MIWPSSRAEYGGDRDHRYVSSGSAAFSADGAFVWARLHGPLAHGEPDRGRGAEEWLVSHDADGTVLARARTGTAAAGSVHVAHPDPGQMGLTIGEGQEGSPLHWGRWDGQALAVERFNDEDRVLLAGQTPG
ncbi:hypothetical protein GCM10010266_68020 [Streptomyces griseomycini]|nr:hypothetical protein GCM10010266_68020 [Streptomyces griseomycini]